MNVGTRAKCLGMHLSYFNTGEFFFSYVRSEMNCPCYNHYNCFHLNVFHFSGLLTGEGTLNMRILLDSTNCTWYLGPLFGGKYQLPLKLILSCLKTHYGWQLAYRCITCLLGPGIFLNFVWGGGGLILLLVSCCLGEGMRLTLALVHLKQF